MSDTETKNKEEKRAGKVACLVRKKNRKLPYQYDHGNFSSALQNGSNRPDEVGENSVAHGALRDGWVNA